MKTLTIQTVAAPLEHAQITAEVTPRKGEPFYVCNPYAELREAWEAGELFEGHMIRGMNPVPVLINPAHIETIRAIDEDVPNPLTGKPFGTHTVYIPKG